MKINYFQKQDIIQVSLQTLNEKSQNTIISNTIYSNGIVVSFYHVYMFIHNWRASVIACFLQKCNYLQPPEVDAFSTVEVILNWVTYFGTKITHSFLEV